MKMDIEVSHTRNILIDLRAVAVDIAVFHIVIKKIKLKKLSVEVCSGLSLRVSKPCTRLGLPGMAVGRTDIFVLLLLLSASFQTMVKLERKKKKEKKKKKKKGGGGGGGRERKKVFSFGEKKRRKKLKREDEC